MEDFATIIWLLVVIGAAIASRSRKARSRSMESEPSGTERTRPADTVSHPTPAKETAWPQIPGFPDLSPRRAPAPQKSAQSVGPAAKSVNPAAKTEKHRPAGQKQGSAFRKREGNSRTTQPGNAVPAGNTTQGGPNAPSPVRAATAIQGSPQHEASAAEIAADFDLRRAVIYAEILKPKFDE